MHQSEADRECRLDAAEAEYGTVHCADCGVDLSDGEGIEAEEWKIGLDGLEDCRTVWLCGECAAS